MKTPSLLLAAAFAACASAPAQNPINVSTGLTASGHPLALHGYDPVSYFRGGLPTVGSARFTATHAGAAFRFASAEHKQLFEKQPQRYLPQFGGFCAYGVSVKQKFDGDPRVFAIVDGKLYLNLNPSIQAIWNKNVAGNIRKANTQWKTVRKAAAPGAAGDPRSTSRSLTAAEQPLAIHGYDPVAFFIDGMAMRGRARLTAVHDGAAYRFVSPIHKRLFEADPAKYLPQYGGFCAYGCSVGKKFDGDPRVFAIVDGKLYFNLNPDIQKLWNKAVDESITKADAHWSKIRNRPALQL